MDKVPMKLWHWIAVAVICGLAGCSTATIEPVVVSEDVWIVKPGTKIGSREVEVGGLWLSGRIAERLMLDAAKGQRKGFVY